MALIHYAIKRLYKFGSAILMVGVPAETLKKNYTRDWDGEKSF
jgi:hypothetical protein